jgi:hypothetical protein
MPGVPSIPAAPRSAGRGDGVPRLELTVVDDQGRSPGVSSYCIEDARGGTTFGKTDEKGKAVVELSRVSRAGDCRVFAGRVDPGRKLYWARERLPAGAESPAAFTLTYNRLSQIEGVVNDADGPRVPNAQIRVWVRGEFPPDDAANSIFEKLLGKAGDFELQSRADAAGVFHLDHLSPDFGLRFELVLPKEDQFQSVSTDLMEESTGASPTLLYRARPPAQYSVILTRHHAAVISATALTWDGLPVPQALVSFRVESVEKTPAELGPRVVLRTDGFGRGKTPMSALADPSTAPVTRTPRYWAAAWKKGLGLAYSSGTLGPAHPEVVVRFPKTQTGPAIQQQVVDQASLLPLRNADVRITSTLFDKAQLAELKTDARGSFTLEGLQAPDAAWKITLEKGFRFFADVRAAGAAPDQTGVPAEAPEVRPGVPGKILLPRKP